VATGGGGEARLQGQGRAKARRGPGVATLSRAAGLGTELRGGGAAGEEREGGLGAQPSSSAASSCVGDGMRCKVEGRVQARGDVGVHDGGASCRRCEGSQGCARVVQG
jgi:hypothetical protein